MGKWGSWQYSLLLRVLVVKTKGDYCDIGSTCTIDALVCPCRHNNVTTDPVQLFVMNTAD